MKNLLNFFLNADFDFYMGIVFMVLSLVLLSAAM
jgi:hypothetical protein